MRSSRRNITRFAPLAMLGLCVALAGCSRAPSVGGSHSSRADKGRKEAEVLAVDAIVAGASAQAQSLPDGGKEIAAKNDSSRGKSSRPKLSPRPGSPAIVHERIKSTIPYLTEAEAEEDALLQARAVVEQKLAELDPPLRHKPSLAEVKAEYIRKDSRTVSPPGSDVAEVLAQSGIKGKLVIVGYDVEVSADQVRELRSQERVSSAMRVVGILIAAALAVFLFLRADEWTKGYLTHWLALAAVMLAGGAAAALIFI